MLMGANAPNIGLSQTLSGTASTQSLFSKNPKLMGGVNPLAESHKNITIKKILHEMERDLGQVEQENYQILKEQAEQRMLKSNPKLALQRQKQMEQQQQLHSMQSVISLGASPAKSVNKLAQGERSKTQKKLIKDVSAEEIPVLGGTFKANIKLNKFEDDDRDKEKPVYTYQLHRLYLKKNGVAHFEKYQPPKKDGEQGSHQPINDDEKRLKEEMDKKAQQQATLDAMNSISLQRNFSLPQLGEKSKNKRGKMQSIKQEQDQKIFNEIFIQPRAYQLSQIIHKHNQQQQSLIQSSLTLSQKAGQLPTIPGSAVNVERVTTAASNMQQRMKNQFLENREQRLMNDKQKLEQSALLQSKRLMEQTEKIFEQELNNMSPSDGKNPENQRLNTAYSAISRDTEMLDDKDPINQGESNHSDDIVKIVMRKFNSGVKLQNSQSFFTQQLSVQPPEGLINSIGNNIKDASWAPSIPISTAFLKQASLKDITLRAKAGVQAGDIQKEAHMAFALGNLNETEKNYKKSIKFYKRFFFCARILEDPVGASLGLNRLGVMYHKLKNYEKSLQFHQKHMQFTDNENIFASYYNLGISYRLLRNFSESTKHFTMALEWAQQHQEFESECISNGQLGVTFLIIKQNEQARQHFEVRLQYGQQSQHCLRVANQLKNRKLSLDCLLCLGYIAFTSEDYKVAKNYFHKAFSDANALNDKELAEQCLCNMGIAMGNISVSNMKRNFSVEVLKKAQVEETEEEDE